MGRFTHRDNDPRFRVGDAVWVEGFVEIIEQNGVRYPKKWDDFRGQDLGIAVNVVGPGRVERLERYGVCVVSGHWGIYRIHQSSLSRERRVADRRKKDTGRPLSIGMRVEVPAFGHIRAIYPNGDVEVPIDTLLVTRRKDEAKPVNMANNGDRRISQRRKEQR
jgi:hypothetical protein